MGYTVSLNPAWQRLNLALLVASTFICAAPATAAELLPETIKAFDRYASILDRRSRQEARFRKTRFA